MSRNSWKDYSKKGLGFGKKGFDKAWQTLDKLGAPVNRLSNRVGAEAFWPMTIDKESDKAARILRSFCKDGFYDRIDAGAEKENGVINDKKKIDRPVGKQRVLKKIPTEVIKQAKGLAIFTTMRTGLWISGAGGSGVLLARIPETGEWSPPSGILLHTAGVGFLVGVDIYDCVVVINTYEALEGFKKLRCTLGGELSAAAGPVGMGGILESEVHKRQAPVWTYLKSRGVYAGVQVDGTIIIERSDENERFYGQKISVHDILAGKARYPPSSIRTLMQTIKAAQGDIDVDEALLPPPGETPGDALIATEEEHPFGVPAVDDPDPFGVRALEEQGLFIREAGTHARPNQEVFEFRPSPSSPIYTTFARQSLDSSRNSWRASVQSSKSVISIDKGTQTDDLPPYPTTSDSGFPPQTVEAVSESPDRNTWDVPDPSDDRVAHGADDEDEHGDIEIHEVSNTTIAKAESVKSAVVAPVEDGSVRNSSPTFSRPRLVTIPKRNPPPALPPRNPERKHDSFSTQSSIPPASPSPTTSMHPEVRESSESSRSDPSPTAFTETTYPKIDGVVNGTDNHFHDGVHPVEKEEFHSMPTSPASDEKPELKMENEA
jgi:lipid-binding SYLF domain-containing protein